MDYLKISLGIFLALAASRFIPHPPNFTSLLALSFYVPAIMGIRYLPALFFGFFATDLFIGFHSVILFTWGSVIFIGLTSKFLKKNALTRLTGSLFGAISFYLITNFGVWTIGNYGYTVEGLVNCFLLALPFFTYSLISTFIYSVTIEGIIKFQNIKIKI